MRFNKNQRLEVRIEESDYLLLQFQASKSNMSVSAYIRMMIETSICPLKGKIRKQELSYEDCKKYIEHKKAVQKAFKGK